MRTLLGIVGVIIVFLAIIIISELYVLIRKKLNKPKYGVDLLTKLIRRDDYVSINGAIYEFSHFTKRGEIIDLLTPPLDTNKILYNGDMAFKKNCTLGYIYLHKNALEKCDFIYGKYGLKWARNITVAKNVKEKINQYIYD